MRVLLDLNIPTSNRFTSAELKRKLGQNEKFEVALKNVVWAHIWSRTANVMTQKRRSHQLLSDLEAYLKSIE